MNEKVNRRVTLAAQPVGAPKDSDFQMIEGSVPVPGDGEILLRTIYLSLDPYMRGRISAARSYAASVEIGQTMVGATVSSVVASNHSKFEPGQLVLGYSGWQDYEVSTGKGLTRLDPNTGPVSTALGVMGMPGLTAYVGLLDIGQPKTGETVVVSSAAGAVGSVAGQIARLKGCRTVGVAGTAEKCRYTVQEFGFEQCLNYNDSNFVERLKDACPGGIDIYFENVGGKVFDAACALMNTAGRIPVCGMISRYNDTALPKGPDTLPRLMRAILTRRLLVCGFIITDHGHRL
ncbi:uncharacterized protein METZ01_LOCUS210271, partial [marine metagenome]